MDYLTIMEVATRLRTTKSALYSQYHKGQAPGALGVKVGRRILWNTEALDDWFNRHAAAAAEKATEIHP